MRRLRRKHQSEKKGEEDILNLKTSSESQEGDEEASVKERGVAKKVSRGTGQEGSP